MLRYIGEYLGITVTIVDNLRYDGKKHMIHINFTNTGNFNVHFANNAFKLYLYNYHMLEPDHLPSKNGYTMTDQYIKLNHVQGSLFSIEPLSTMPDIAPNGTVTLKLLAKGNSVAKSDIPPNWYGASKGLEPVLMQSTQTGKPFVTDFKNPGQWKRDRSDLYNPFTLQQRYERFATKDLGGIGKQIIPTPEVINVKEGNKLDISNFTIICNPDVKKEAQFLAGMVVILFVYQ